MLPARSTVFAMGVLVLMQLVGCRQRNNGTTVAKTPLEYNFRTSVGAYDSVGKTSSKWDAEARDCLTEFATKAAATNLGVDMAGMKAKLNHLHELECTDPMINYLYARFVFSDTHSGAECAEEFGKVASALEHSDYPDSRKFFGLLWYGHALNWAGQQNDSGKTYVKSARYLADSLKDRAIPETLADTFCNDLLSVR